MSKMRKTGSVQSFRESILAFQVASCGIHMDATLGILEESRLKKKHAELIRRLAKELRFTYDEVEKMVLVYYKFQKEAGNVEGIMTRNQLKEILHQGFDMTDNDINDSVVRVLDRAASQNVTMEAWVRAMSLFLRGTFDDKVHHCFNVYDIYGQGVISRTQMMNLLDHAIHGEDETEDVVKDLLELMANKIDKNRDGKITYDDFYKTVKEEPLMMEAFGQCLPSRLAAHAFRTTFTQFNGKYY